MAKIQIDKDRVLSRGDRIELHFQSVGMTWIKAAQIALIEERLKGRDDFEIISIQAPIDEPASLIIKCEVIGGPRPPGQTPGATGSWLIAGFAGSGALITCASIAGVIIAAGIVYNLTLKETFLIVAETTSKVVESPAGQIAVAGTGIGIATAGIAALLLLFLRK